MAKPLKITILIVIQGNSSCKHPSKVLKSLLFGALEMLFYRAVGSALATAYSQEGKSNYSKAPSSFHHEFHLR